MKWTRKERLRSVASRCARGLVRASTENEGQWQTVGEDLTLARVKREGDVYVIDDPVRSSTRQTDNETEAIALLVDAWQASAENASKRGRLEALLRRRSIELGEPRIAVVGKRARNPDKVAGKLQARFTLEPFSTLSGSKWRREETISVADLRLIRCNACGAFAVLRNDEGIHHWIDGEHRVERLYGEREKLMHEPNCPLSQKEAPCDLQDRCLDIDNA